MAVYLTVLTFHKIDDNRSVISFSPELFRRSIEKLCRNGHRALRLTDAAQLIRQRKPFPAGLGLLTGESELYALERVDAYYLRGERLFDLMLTKSFPLNVLLRNIPRTIRRRFGGR